jgi:hypothetical protein
MKIKGKRDDTWLHFAIWDDKDCPEEFSAAHAILLWISLTGIKGGFCFLAWSNSTKKLRLQQSIMAMVLEDFKYICACILKKDMTSQRMKNLVLGTHMLRKTAFLIAYWAHHNPSAWDRKLNPLDDASILLDARHKNVSSTVTYLSDSVTPTVSTSMLVGMTQYLSRPLTTFLL